jgi:uroporphyrinogen III methyltransferase/synthase
VTELVLTGVRVVITRPKEASSKLTGMLTDLGAEVLEVPTIEVAPPESWEPADDSLRRLATFDWLAFNSVNAVEAFVGRAKDLGLEDLSKRKIAAVGGVTSARLEALGLRPRLVPDRASAVALAEEMGPGDGRRVLVPRAAEVPPDMRDTLRRSGWSVEEVPVYRTVTAERGPLADRIENGDFDVVVFSSGSAVRGFVDLFGPPENSGLATDSSTSKKVVSIGPVTTEAAEAAGFRVDATAETQNGEGLVDAIRRVGALRA